MGAVDVYSVAVAEAAKILLRDLWRLLNRMGVKPDTDEAVKAVSDVFVREAVVLMRACNVRTWAAACRFLVGEAKARGVSNPFLPAPPSYSERQLRAILAAVGGDVWHRESRVLFLAHVRLHALNAARDSVRRSASGLVTLPSSMVADSSVDHGKLARVLRMEHEYSRAVRSGSSVAIRHAERALSDAMAALDDNERELMGVVRDFEAAKTAQRRREAWRVIDGGEPEYDDGGEPSDSDLRESKKAGRPVKSVAYARVIQGEWTCGFCVMLASRGAVYHSLKSASVASKRDYSESGSYDGAYHFHCDCLVVPVYSVASWTGQKEADRLYELWKKYGAKQGLQSFNRLMEQWAREGKNPGRVSPLKAA